MLKLFNFDASDKNIQVEKNSSANLRKYVRWSRMFQKNKEKSQIDEA